MFTALAESYYMPMIIDSEMAIVKSIIVIIIVR